jgi:drug/metabolite transporter (DMT)-like permease
VLDLKSALSLPFSWSMFLPLLYLAVFASSLAFILYIRSIDKIGATRSTVLVNLIPAFTAIFSYFLLGEKMGLTRLLGVGVVILGVFIAQVKAKETESPEEISTHF